MDERLAAIREEFERYGYEIIVERSTRGEQRGGWFARYRSVEDRAAAGGVASGNTQLEAAEVALKRFRRQPRTLRPGA
jgi:hypothetical protein